MFVSFQSIICDSTVSTYAIIFTRNASLLVFTIYDINNIVTVIVVMYI